MGQVSSRPPSRRHLEAVPDPSTHAGARRGKTGSALSLSDRCEPAPPVRRRDGRATTAQPADPLRAPAADGAPDPASEDITAADICRLLADLGAPADLTQAVAEFGDDLPALATWLQEIGAFGAPGDVLEPMLAQWTDLLEPGVGALAAEICAGEFLHSFHAAADGSPCQIDAMDFLLREVAATGRPEALAMCRCLAHLGPPVIRPTARRSAQDLLEAGLADQPWVADLDRAEFAAAFAYVEAAQESLVLEFRRADTGHAVVVVVDHRRGGGIQDLFVVDDAQVLRREVRQAATTRGFAITPLPAPQAAARLQAALAAPSCATEPDEIVGVGVHLPLLQDRLTRLPTSG